MSAKWSENCEPEKLAREFAGSVLAERVEVVASLLPHVAHGPEQDAEHVHQLRVSCRRAAAALRAFAPLMSDKPKKLKKWLSTIRDAASPARDIDVLVGRFGEEADNIVAAYAVERLSHERDAAGRRLVEVAKLAMNGKLNRAANKTINMLKKGSSKELLGEFGRDAVRQAYLPFSRLAEVDEPTTRDLHQLRIVGKRLRYSLEIFHGIFPARLRDRLYPMVEELQEKLGTINDHATAQALYQRWLGEMEANELAAEIAGRIVEEFHSAERLADRFLTWWNDRRRSTLETFFKKQGVILE